MCYRSLNVVSAWTPASAERWERRVGRKGEYEVRNDWNYCMVSSECGHRYGSPLIVDTKLSYSDPNDDVIGNVICPTIIHQSPHSLTVDYGQHGAQQVCVHYALGGKHFSQACDEFSTLNVRATHFRSSFSGAEMMWSSTSEIHGWLCNRFR